MPGTVAVDRSGNQDADGLLAGVRWETNNLSFSFPNSGSFYGAVYGSAEHLTGFEPLNSGQKVVVRDILAMISSVTNLVFNELTESSTTHATLRFAMSDVPGTAWGYYPHPAEEGGDSWYRNSGGTYDTPTIGNYAHHTFMHEIGHALGLKHGQDTDVYGSMTAPHDSMEYSVMTYRSYVGAPGDFYYNETWGYAQTLMMYDIAALQHMYGADFSTNSTDTIYRWNPGTGEMSINGVGQGNPGENRVFMTVWDGGGVDTYNLSNYGNGVSIDLRPGEWTTTSPVQLANLGNNNLARGNIANALQFQGDARSLIENAVGGSGNDTIFGNATANILDGGGGSDTIVLAGTRVDYNFSGTAASLTAAGFGVSDSIRNAEFVRFLGSNETVSVANLLSANSGVTITGTAANDVISPTRTTTGQPLPTATGDRIFGLAGADQLDGGLGGDRMEGGLGNDIYTVESSGDLVVELAAEGVDLVKAFITYVLPDQVEKLTLMGSQALNGTGNGLNNIMTGNSAANKLEGLAGNDQLKGGSGNDILNGGLGNDGLLGGLGDDLLTGGDGLDKLTGGTGRDTLTGNALADRFIFEKINESTVALSDLITDFSRSDGDRIDLSKIDANTVSANNQAFSFIGTNGFSGGGAAGAGQLRYQQVNGQTQISGDVNGDGSADFLIKLGSVVALQATDFIL